MIARSPEITRDHPRSPERRGSPARHAAGRSAPAAAQTRRTRADGPRGRHRPAQRGRRSQGHTSSGAQTRRRPVPPRARPAPPRRRAVLCSRRRRTAAPGAGAVALALRCLLAGGRGAPPAPGGMCHGHVMETEGRPGRPLGCVRATQSQVWEGYDTTTVSLYSAPRAPRRRRVAPRT